MQDWRERIETNLTRLDSQRVRALFTEINPHLVGDSRFESRWTQKRRQAAVLVPIVNRPEGPTVLLTVRSSDMPSHAGQISFPGGKAHEEDQGPIDTALREAEEEVNIPRAFVDVVGALGVHEGGLGFSVTPVIGLVDPAAPIRACPREVAEMCRLANAGKFAEADEKLRVRLVPTAEQVEAADGRHDDRRADHRPEHRVRVLGEEPGVREERREALELEAAAEAFRTARDRKAGAIKVVLEP